MKKKSFIFSIRGHKWKFVLLRDDLFVKEHGEAVYGITMPDSKTVHLRLDHFTKWHVAHELGHVYTSYMHIDSANITAGDMEEMMVSFFASEGDEYIQTRDKIYNKINNFLKQKEQKDEQQIERT